MRKRHQSLAIDPWPRSSVSLQASNALLKLGDVLLPLDAVGYTLTAYHANSVIKSEIFQIVRRGEQDR
jgi:hypothetical protein